jgi:alkane 1-monooxygenase
VRDVAGLWVRHLAALFIPLLSLVFLRTGPHAWYVAPLFMLPLIAAHQIDCSARYERRQPEASLPAWPFDVLVYALAGLQLWIVVETVRLFQVQSLFSVDMVMTFVLVGGSSGFSIITAHELIHRRKRWEQGLGRLLLCSVLYEHFYTEHLRGHHVRVGTAEDPATARFGESYQAFFRRTVPAQLRSAWHLEKRRLGDPDMGLLDRRMLRNRILHGFALEWSVAFGILLAFGLAAFVAFLIQAWSAVRLLEAVNYFEHWGLLRRRSRVRPVDSWDTHSWFTFYGLVGLSRHADHHAWPARPYQQLRVWDEAPLLPFGYVGMVDLVLERNDEFQRLATLELARRRLGPFVEAEESAPIDAASALSRLASEQPAPAAAPWLPTPVRVALGLALVVLVATLGVQWETGGLAMGPFARTLLCGWILAVFVLVIRLRLWLKARGNLEIVSWAVALTGLLVLGRLTEALLSPLLG